MKKISVVVIILTLSLLLPFNSAALKSEKSFFDVNQSDWFYPYVSYLANQEIIKGKTENEFFPNDTLSVAELCALIARYHELDSKAQDYNGENWFDGYVTLMLKGGIIKKGEFGVGEKDGNALIDENSAALLNAPIQRQQAARMIARSFEIEDDSFSGSYNENAKYGYNFIVGGGYSSELLPAYGKLIADISQIDAEYLTDVEKCYYNGIFAGDENGNFNPKASLTRAEGAKIIAAVIDLSLRTREELRDVKISADSSGRLTQESKKELLLNIADSARAENGVLYLTLENNLPFGYYTEILISRQLYGRCYTAYRYGLMTKENSYPIDIDVRMTYNGEPCIIHALYILRDMWQKGDICATLEVVYTKEGTKSYSFDIK